VKTSRNGLPHGIDHRIDDYSNEPVEPPSIAVKD
jgi:hypothetical protein